MHSLQTLLRICPIVPQVCNAVYLRLNFSVPLCACPEPGDPCSASTLASDGHSLGLTADQASGKVRTYPSFHLFSPYLHLIPPSTQPTSSPIQGAHPGKDLRGGRIDPHVRPEPGLEHPRPAEHPHWQGALPGHMHLSGLWLSG